MNDPEAFPLWPRAEGLASDQPRERELSSVPAHQAADAESRARRPGRVLIVDDSRDAREMYTLYFRLHGYHAFMANDGHAAVEMATKFKPDVIVMDFAMPGMSGISATHQLKNNPRTKSSAVILLTGHQARAIAEGALEMGVDVFLTKPCLPEDLETHVRRLIEDRRR